MLDLLIVILCLAINAIFSAYEMAFVTVSKDDIDEVDGSNHHLHKQINSFKSNPERTLSVIQIGITLVGAIAAAVGGTGAVEGLQPQLIERYNMSKAMAQALSVTMVIVPLTYFSVVFGELVPKTIALRHPEMVLAFGTRIIFLIDKILSPIVSLLGSSTSFILRILKLGKETDEDFPETIEIGNLPPYHRRYVQNLVSLRSKKIKYCMVPWERVSFLNYSDTDEEVRDKVRETKRSRFPVVDGDTLVGIFHVKEWKEVINGTLVPWQSILGPVHTFSEEDKVMDAFLKMQECNDHLAVICSSDKSFSGIITLADVMEQIVGKIKDDLERNRTARLLSRRRKLSFRK
jgi:putative hemolysin